MAVLSRKQKAKIISQHLKKSGSDFDTTCEIAAIWDALKEIERKENKNDNSSVIPDHTILQPGEKAYAVPIKDGYLDIAVTTDSDYPGVDIEYISNKENELDDNKLYVRPRILIENNEGVLRTLIWEDHNSEDYSDDVDFTCVEDF